MPLSSFEALAKGPAAVAFPLELVVIRVSIGGNRGEEVGRPAVVKQQVRALPPPDLDGGAVDERHRVVVGGLLDLPVPRA